MSKSQIDKIQSAQKDLIRFEQNGIEVYIDKATGETFASLRGVARMAEKNEGTVQRFKVLRNFELQITQVNTQGGLQGVALFNEEQIFEVLEKYSKERLK